MNEFYQDNITKDFTDLNDMLAFLSERETQALWEKRPANTLRVANLERCPSVIDQYESIGMSAVIEDTLQNTKLLLTPTQSSSFSYLPIRSCAISSLLERARISGAALQKISTDVLVYIINECLKVAPNGSKLRIADEKISAVLSSEYVEMNMPELFTVAADFIQSRFKRNTFAGGNWSHVITSAYWELTDEESLIKTYKNSLDRHGISYTELQPAIRLSSSDIGVCAVNLVPKLFVGKEAMALPLGKSIALEHKNGANLSKFKENLNMAFAQYSTHLHKLSSLLDIEIEYPANCLAGAMKRLGISKKVGMTAIEMFIARMDNAPCTAHDLYYGFGELLFLLQMNQATGEQIIRMEETIARALALNWKEYDFPSEVPW